MRFVFMFAALGVAAGVVATAQTQRVGAPARVIGAADSVVPGYQLVVVQAEFPADATTGWHTHPGEMVGSVLEGRFVIEQPGVAPRTLSAGQAFIVPAGTPHVDTNAGRTHARMHATYLVKKGMPVRANIDRQR
jgi:quercetin dioxygenase-like cupin family protein